MDPLYLGIDLGTSKVALVLTDRDGSQAHVASALHEAETGIAAEQDAERIVAAARQLLDDIPGALRDRIAAVGLTGQMHGVVRHEAGRAMSPLVTWQDQRSARNLSRPLPAGFGFNTMVRWLEAGGWKKGSASTIHGLLAARLCGLERAPIDPTDWQAWGGDPVPDGIPTDLLPTRVAHGAIVGRTTAAHSLPAGIPVVAPLGDNQASIVATLRDCPQALSLTIGTGCQLSARVPIGWAEPLPPGCERRPFNREEDLVVAAPRAGGAAWRWLATRVQGWIEELGLPPQSLPDLYAQLDRLGMAAARELTFLPHLDGERHGPDLTASLEGFRLHNGRLGEIALAVASGINRNARALFPEAVLQEREVVMGSGNALRRSDLIRREAEHALGKPIILTHIQEEAATGAALRAAEHGAS